MAMARKARKKRTISIRKLARVDEQARLHMNVQGRVIGGIQDAGFETIYPFARYPNRVLFGPPDRRIMVAVWPVVTDDNVERTAARMKDLPADEFWLVGELDRTSDVIDYRERYSPKLKIMNVAEFEMALSRFPRPALKQGPPPARTRVVKALIANADELQTATATSLALVEDRIAVLSQERPNSDQSIAQRDNELKALTQMKGQLETIRNLPGELKKGQVSEKDANKSIKSFSDGVREYWNANSEVICGKAVNIALFTSTVLVCKLAGASGDLTIAVSAAVAGGKTVMDGLKGIMRRVFKG
ncbi:hypothetical protein [Bradyrhizobium elkanii]